MLRADHRCLVPLLIGLLVLIAAPTPAARGADETVEARLDRLIREIKAPGRSHEQRAESIRRLAYLGMLAAPATPALVKELKSDNLLIQEMTLFALGMIGPKGAAALPALKDLIFSSPDPFIPEAAGDAIKLIKSSMPDGVRTPDLRAEPKAGASLEEDPLRNAMILLLGIESGTIIDGAKEVEEMGPRAAAALPALYRLVERSGNAGVRTAARKAIEAIRAPAEPDTEEGPANPLAPDNPTAQDEPSAPEEPEEPGEPETIASMVAGYIADLASTEATKRWQAAMNLGLLGREASAAVPALSKALGDPDAFVRMWVASALGKMAPESKPALDRLRTVAAEDPDSEVRRTAALAVEQILAVAPETPATGAGPAPKPVGPSLIGDWKGGFITDAGVFVEVISFLSGGIVEAVILTARGVKVWSGRGKFTYLSGTLHVEFPGEDPQDLPVTWLNNDSFKTTSRGIRIRFHRLK